METKNYISPDLTIVEVDSLDIITTSDILSGVETTPVPDEGGTWETL